MEIYRALISFHDFFFYASREYGGRAITEELIHNYALMYALNNFSRLVAKPTPYYEDDLPKFSIYATPARPYRGIAFVSRRKFNWDWNDPVWISYNAIDSYLLFSMEKEKILNRKFVVPKYGAYQRYPPLDTFEFFVIGKKPGRSLIRIGKKLAPARVRYFKCVEIKERRGLFSPSHIVNAYEIRNTHEIVSGTILTIPPTPVIIDARLRGSYYECRYLNENNNEKKAIIVKPDPQFYKGVDIE